MSQKPNLLVHLLVLALGLTTVVSCKDPFGGVDGTNHEVEPEDCAASAEWLPNTPAYVAQNFKPLPHPETECPFYRGGWQNFLIATQEINGEPAIKSYLTIDDIFDKTVKLPAGSLAPVGQPRGTSKRSWLGDIKQAGQREILVDQNGHTLYYGIHVNQAFADFIDKNDLRTAEKIQAYPNDPKKKDLFFPPGLVEFKSAWQEVDGIDDPKDPMLSNWIATRAYVPNLTVGKDANGGDAILEDRDHPRLITVRLLAIHVVFTLPGHPEFVWASFEHSAVGSGESDTSAVDHHRDVAPINPSDKNPDPNDPAAGTNDPTIIDMTTDGELYKHGTAGMDANRALPEGQLAGAFNAATQTFEGMQTSIYRMYPASKSNTTEADPAITTLNMNVQSLFANFPDDRRGHYRLIGAQWLDKPAMYKVNVPLQNTKDSVNPEFSSPLLADPNSDVYKAATAGDVQESERQAAFKAGSNGIDDILANGSDSPFSMTAGEDRLSSTAMESFTQNILTFPNCFQCHNTQGINANGTTIIRDKGSPKLLDPGLLNVSHVISQFVLEECSGTAPASIPKSCSQCQNTPPPPECLP